MRLNKRPTALATTKQHEEQHPEQLQKLCNSSSSSRNSNGNSSRSNSRDTTSRSSSTDRNRNRGWRKEHDGVRWDQGKWNMRTKMMK